MLNLYVSGEALFSGNKQQQQQQKRPVLSVWRGIN